MANATARLVLTPWRRAALPLATPRGPLRHRQGCWPLPRPGPVVNRASVTSAACLQAVTPDGGPTSDLEAKVTEALQQAVHYLTKAEAAGLGDTDRAKDRDRDLHGLQPSRADRWKQLKDTSRDIRDLLDMYLADKAWDRATEAYLMDDAARAVLEAQQLYYDALLLGGFFFRCDETDRLDCYVELRPGAGGTESMEWASMLARMYLRWANANGRFSVSLASTVDESSAEVPGCIKHATLLVRGPYAYGWLKHEVGVHRLVRVSPFDAAVPRHVDGNRRRHTSFASVTTYPAAPDDAEMADAAEVNAAMAPQHLRIDVYRASGAGGQHVNKTESAVRIVHVPTGITVQCQSDRSQHRNREMAMKMLRAKLFEQLYRRREQARAEANAQKLPNAWGSQVRSYILHPYHLVKDHRTKMTHRDPEAVLDGDLDRFVARFLTLCGCADGR